MVARVSYVAWRRMAMAGTSLIAMSHGLAAQEQSASQSGPARPSILRLMDRVTIVPLSAAPSTPLPAIPSTQIRVSIPPGPLEPALEVLAKRVGLKLAYETALIEGRTTRGVKGKLQPLEALTRLLDGTGLTYRAAGASTITLMNPRYVQLGAADSASEVTLEELSVTGRGTGQPPPTGTVGQVPPVYAGGQVSATGRVGFLGNRSVFDTPFTQANYSAELARDQGARTVADVLANNPSVRATIAPFGIQDNIYIRGFLLNSRDFAFDGLYGIVDARKAIIENVERFEIQNGPAAFLYGFPPAGGIGGVVNLIPKRATDAPITRVSADYLNSSYAGGQVDVGRRFGDANSLGVRINAFYHEGNTPIDYQRLQNGGATIGLDYRGTDFRWSLDLGYHHLGYRASTQGFSVLPGFKIPRAPDLTINQQPRWAFTDVDSGFATTRAEYDIAPGWTTFAALGGSRTEELFVYPSYSLINARGDLRGSTFLFPDQQTQFTAEVGVRGNFDTGPFHHAVSLVGTEYIQNNPYALGIGPTVLSNLYTGAAFSAPPSLSLIPRIVAPQTAELMGIAGVDTITLVPDAVDLIVGVRAQSAAQKVYNTTTGALTTSYDQGAITPLAAMVIKPLPFLSLYASYAEGLSFGPVAPNTALNAGQASPPVVSTQLETGIKLDLGTVGLTAAFYDIAQPSGFTNPVTRIFAVNGEQRNKGVDLNIFGSPVDGFRLLGGITLLDGRLSKTAGGAFNGNVAPGVPNIQLNLGAEVDLPRWLLPGLTLAGRVIYTASQYYDQANTQKIPDWTRLDVGLRYRFIVNDTPLIARFNVENVAGLNYYQSTGQGILNLGTPRTFKFSLTADL